MSRLPALASIMLPSDKMFEFLQAALAEGDPYLTRMDAEPYFDAFRSEPRYRDLLHRMNLS